MQLRQFFCRHQFHQINFGAWTADYINKYDVRKFDVRCLKCRKILLVGMEAR